ncbi:MAG: RNA polymerase sigma factor [Gammaproteobacteria bacterium]|nr:RNA polymerase sigma factor [Gammaproteobacteria bacterium]
MSSKFSQAVDTAVIDRARSGDMQAFEALYRQFGGPVLGLARRILQRNDLADEVVQDTFIDVMRKIDGFRGDSPLGMWIRRIAVNRCLMLLRSYWEQHRVDEADGEKFHAERALGIDLLTASDLESLLGQLSPEGRTVLWLHEVEGYTHEEIGGLLGRTSSFSKSQLARSYARLQALVATSATEDRAP